MTRKPCAIAVLFRHSSWRILLLLFLANILCGANPALTLQVSNETAPPGGYAQFKISLTTPTLISSGSVTMNFDPTIFGNIASVAAFSATGDQAGYASLNGTQVTAYFSAPTSSLGQLPEMPVFAVTVPILATAKIGATVRRIDELLAEEGERHRHRVNRKHPLDAHGLRVSL